MGMGWMKMVWCSGGWCDGVNGVGGEWMKVSMVL